MKNKTYKFLQSYKINDKLKVNIYEEYVIGLEHFCFEEEVLLSENSLQKVLKMVQLYKDKQTDMKGNN